MMAGGKRIWAGGFALAGLFMMGAFASDAKAEQPQVVVEMFTAQGCAACPPADAIFAAYADQPGVIALSLHVDYWDYLGWQDSFGSRAHTERQKAYARAAKAKMIYTPQVIVGGSDRVQGTQSAEIEALLKSHAEMPAAVALQARHHAGAVTIEAAALAPLSQSAVVQFVRYRPSELVSIEDGENAGQTVEYRNIVVDWQSIAAWDGQTRLEMTTEVSPEISKDLPLVVILQQDGHGPVLAAARLD